MNKLQRNEARPLLYTGADRYVQVLLSAGDAAGRVSLAQAQGVHRRMEAMLTQIAVTYTFGASASMPAETAKQLLASAIYAMGLALKAAPSPDAALDRLLSEPPDSLRREGIGMIEGMAAHARECLAALQSAPVTQNRAYLDTVVHGLSLFFASYDKTYAAHETPGSIDYPLCMDVGKLTGIEYAAAYIGALSAEAAFLSRWPSQHIDALLRGYSSGWRDLLVNAYEVALTNALGRVLCSHDLSCLSLTADDCAYLSGRLCALPPARLRAMLGVALGRLGLDANGMAYARRALPRLASTMKTALDTGHPETVFLSPAAPPASVVCFIDGPKMDDEQFRTLTEVIRECRHFCDKLALIRRHVKSLRDLTDLLSANVMSGCDFAELFKALDAVTLRQLAALVPEDSFHATSAEQEWHAALKKHLAESRTGPA